MNRLPLAALLAFALAAPAHADFNDAVVAHAMGDYERALQTLVPLAETSDHAYAQYYLGVMYANGQGVEQDYEEAAQWYRRAAEKGVAAAQAKLGQLYERGLGVPKDMEFAYAWYGVASSLGNGRAAGYIEKTRQKMNPRELEEAQQLADEYIARYGEAPKGTRTPGSESESE